MDEATKDSLTARFRAYLDAAGGEPEAGQAEDSAPDLYTLLAEVAALKAEVKRESRQVKTALDEFRDLFDVLRGSYSRLDEEQQLRREQERLGGERALKDLLLELLDLRDRLQAGQAQAARFRPGWRTGRVAAGFIVSMSEGMAMNLRRLDETLVRRGVRPVRAMGRSFDPHTMHAAEVANDPAAAPGLVVGELRTGYLQGNQLLRPAEVAVNRPGNPNTTEAGQ